MGLDVARKDVVLGESEEPGEEEGEGEDGDALCVERCGDVDVSRGGLWFRGGEGGEDDSDGDYEYGDELLEGISGCDRWVVGERGMGRGTYCFLMMSQPRKMLMIMPPLRKTMWTDMGMSYANAALLRTERAKKSATCARYGKRGTLRFLSRGSHERGSVVSWLGRA